MAHAVFQTAQIMPINTQANIPISPSAPWLSLRPQIPVPVKFQRRCHAAAVRCSSSPPAPAPLVDDGAGGVWASVRTALERCFQAPCNSSNSGEAGPLMKGQYGALGSVTLEKSKLDLSQKQAKFSPELLCGSDRLMTNHFDVIGVALFIGTAMRVMNVNMGGKLRRAWLGIEADPLVHSDDLLKAYNRPESDISADHTSKWFISKNPIVSGLGLLGIKQGNGETEAPTPKARRKRIVRKKVTASSI
ncbi:hypothetical protein SAY87_008028 [Trapa incisa]|uniref:Uncharacterized protein n=1 Tax=Trapa incisa TaxID=236973 RepID=A0AAN7KLI8_9MYRT|nr:hypothetical protein SAY87_008028 [Trapa incisa]